MIAFTVYGKPEPAGSKSAYPVGKRCSHGRAARWVVSDANSKAKRWQKEVAKQAALAMGDRALFDGPLRVALTFYIERPKNHLKANGELSAEGARRPYPTVRPDVLKLARAIEDAMTGVVYLDDARIVDEPLSEFYGVPQRAEVVVSEITSEPPPYAEHEVLF